MSIRDVVVLAASAAVLLASGGARAQATAPAPAGPYPPLPPPASPPPSSSAAAVAPSPPPASYPARSSSAYGVYGDVFLGPLSGPLSWRHEKAVSLPGTSVNELAGHTCLATGREKKKNGLALCFDGRYTTGDVAYGDPLRFSTANAAYFGITLGLGTTTSKEKD